MDKDIIKKIIEEIFTGVSCKIDEVIFTEDGDMLWCSISTPDSRFMIGKDGETLRSFNHIVKKMLEKHTSEEELQKLTLDINDYQEWMHSSEPNTLCERQCAHESLLES